MEHRWKFPSPEYERTYHEARDLLAIMDAELKRDADRLMREIRTLPEDVQRRRIAEANREFHKLREPYIRMVADVLAFAAPVITIPA